MTRVVEHGDFADYVVGRVPKVGQLYLFRLVVRLSIPYGSGAYGNRYQVSVARLLHHSYLNFHQTMIPTDGSVES